MFNKSQPNKFDERKSLELIDAATGGNMDTIDSLIQNGANFNYVDELGDTALSQAALNRHAKTVKKLLSYLSARYSKNRALVLATQAGHTEIMNMLMDAKAETQPLMLSS